MNQATLQFFIQGLH